MGRVTDTSVTKRTAVKMPILWGCASLVLCLGAAWSAGWAYDALVAARPQWALWIPQATILNLPELQLVVIAPLLPVLVMALIGGILSHRAFVGKLAMIVSIVAILQSAGMAARDIHDMAVLNNWAHLYHAAQRKQATRPPKIQHEADPR